jgi:hypothetical protein
MGTIKATWSAESAKILLDAYGDKKVMPAKDHKTQGLPKKLIRGVVPTLEQKKALKFARGFYQRALILERIAWSRGGLKGSARGYDSRYGRSRRVLLERLEAAEVAFLFIGPHGRFVLRYGKPSEDMEKKAARFHHVWKMKK